MTCGRMSQYVAWVSVIALVVAVLAGCSSERHWRHVELDRWMWKIQDGKGTQRPLFSSRDYYELLADLLFDEYKSVRIATANTLRTCTVAIGHKYVYLLDASIDQGRDEMLYERLKAARRRSPQNSKERHRFLKALVQVHMRRYLWEHPNFGQSLRIEIDSNEPEWRGFDNFWPDHYPEFAERLLAEGNAEFAKHWAEFRRVNRCLYGHDPGARKRREPDPSKLLRKQMREFEVTQALSRAGYDTMPAQRHPYSGGGGVCVYASARGESRGGVVVEWTDAPGGLVIARWGRLPEIGPGPVPMQRLQAALDGANGPAASGSQ